MKQKHITLIMLVVLLNVSKKSWKQVPKYYKSLAYVSFINAFYYYLCRNYFLWEFRPRKINRKWLRAVHILFVTPSLALLSLSSYPETLNKQIWHIGKWSFLSTFGEYIAVKMKLIDYRHGWNVFWSGIIFTILYVYSYLHTKKPMETWILSVVTLVFL
ncbi:CBO0543 family protein [Halalkalibacter alkalisediminis]|uniref:CBO0543 family protein n=1 Tax=Halalkalibacter alkalisediminis TaxID=935616 RepID=A0ABV6NH04_9BACI|nr:CBO0543 family protein [Halalkalibacter alkalisediminis]